jgi:hypothetical protein
MKHSKQMLAAIAHAIGDQIIHVTVKRLGVAKTAETRLDAFQRALRELVALEKAGYPTRAADQRLFTLLCAVFPSVLGETT